MLIFIISGFFFTKSEGLVMKGEEKDLYVTELLSSGSDDNITIEFSIILFIPVMIISLFKIKETMHLIEYLFNNFIFLLQIMILSLIEAGSILNTILYKYNKALWVWLISFVMIICLTQFLYFNKMEIQDSPIEGDPEAK